MFEVVKLGLGVTVEATSLGVLTCRLLYINNPLVVRFGLVFYFTNKAKLYCKPQLTSVVEVNIREGKREREEVREAVVAECLPLSLFYCCYVSLAMFRSSQAQLMYRKVN